MDAAASLNTADPDGLPPIQGARPIIHASIGAETPMNDTERAAGFLHRLGMRSPVLSTITTTTSFTTITGSSPATPTTTSSSPTPTPNKTGDPHPELTGNDHRNLADGLT